MGKTNEKDLLLPLHSRIIPEEKIEAIVQGWRLRSESVIFTNGCFDILHRGHVEYLTAAKALGHRLIIAVNSDSSVRGLDKGDGRPVNNQEDRATVLAALRVADAIVIFNDPTPINLIKKLKPGFYVKGGDYTEETLPEAKEVKAYGGEVHIIPLSNGFSTTNLIEKLKK